MVSIIHMKPTVYKTEHLTHCFLYIETEDNRRIFPYSLCIEKN